MLPLRSPKTTDLPSAENVRDRTSRPWAHSRILLPLSGDHSRTLPSAPQVATHLPSELTATLRTQPSWAASIDQVGRGAFSAKGQQDSRPQLSAEKRCLPSGWNASACTQP